jgi:hypothetical protein
MDAATLYMVVRMATGVEYTDKVIPMDSAVECRKAARSLRRGRIAALYKARGMKLKVYCGRPYKPMVIAR